MAACADIEFERDEVYETDLKNNSHHNVTHSENNQNDQPKKLFFQLDSNWGKRKTFPYSFEKVLASTQTLNITITDECALG